MLALSYCQSFWVWSCHWCTMMVDRKRVGDIINFTLIATKCLLYPFLALPPSYKGVIKYLSKIFRRYKVWVGLIITSTKNWIQFEFQLRRWLCLHCMNSFRKRMNPLQLTLCSITKYLYKISLWWHTMMVDRREWMSEHLDKPFFYNYLNCPGISSKKLLPP